MTAKPRYRLRFDFWLNMNKSDEVEIADDIERWKNDRRFAAIIRDGLRLMKSLQQRDTSVLLELFPWIGESLGIEKSGGDTTRLEREIESLKSLILQQSSAGNTLHAAGPRPKLDLPRFSETEDDEAPTLVIKKDTKTNSSQNFLNSLMALQQ